MNEIIDIKIARELFGKSKERKEQLRNSISNLIKDAAESGICVVGFPVWMKQPEKDWLTDELILAGYTVSDQTISWS